MTTPRDRATRNLRVATGQVKSVLNAIETQVSDTKDVLTAAMEPGYTAREGIADLAALWINGLSIPAAFVYGFIKPKPKAGSGGGQP